MKKILLLNKGELQEMSFEDCIKRYETLVGTIIKIYVNYFEHEDLKQVGLLGLWKAYKDYDLNRGVGFGHVARFYIQNQISDFVRYTNRHNVRADSYNAVLRHNNEEYELIDVIQDAKNYYEEVESEMVMDSLLEVLTEQQKKIVDLRIKGHSQLQIANILNTNQAWVSRCLKASKKKLSAIA